MRNLRLAATLGTALLAAGCTSPAEPSPTQTSTAPAAPSAAPTSVVPSPEPTAAEPTEAEPTAAQPAGGCPDGQYTLVKFSERDTGNLVATGDDLTAMFAQGQYVLFAPGRSAYTLTNGTQEADMLIKGTIAGRYTGKGDGLRYNRGKVNGKITFKAAGRSRSESMESAAATLAPQGKVPTTCTGDRMTMELPLALLEFERR